MEQKEILLNLLFFLGVFLLSFGITYFINLHKFKHRKEKNIAELYYLIMKFRLDKNKLNTRKMLIWFSFIDAFIMAFVSTFLSFIKIDTVWQMVIGFVLLVCLIYSFYEIYGRHLVNIEKRKEEKKNV